MSDPLQIWVRNDKGKVWGPLMPATLELLFDSALIPGRIQLSLDGTNFVYPARLPEVRDCVPQELWGEGSDGAPAAPVAAPVLTPSAPSKIPGGPPSLTPAPGPGAAAAAAAANAARPASAAMAGPGATAAAAQPRPAPAPVAGPGAAAAAQARAAAAAAPPVRAADKRTLSPELGAAVAAPAPAPAPIAAVVLQTLEIPPKGTLQTTSALRLYYLAASSDANGLLSLTLSDRTVLIHFRKGNPEFVDSTHAEDQLATFLVKNQLANFDQLGKAEKEKARFGGELVGALFGLGILNPGTAFQHLGLRAASILVRGLFAEHGTFTWELKDLPAHKAMPLGNRWAVVSEQVRKLPGTDLRRRLNTAIDLPVMKSGGQVAVVDLRLTPQETRALAYFDGVRSLNQLIHDLPNEIDHILRVAFLLKELEAVSFASVRVPPPETSSAPPPTVAAPAPVPVAPAPPAPATVPGPPPRIAQPAAPPRPPPPKMAPTSPAAAPRAVPTVTAAPSVALDPQAEIKQLTATLEKMKTQNHFEVLGLKDNVDGAAVKLAYFKFARAYHPDTVPPGAPPLVGKLKEEIFGRVGEANRTLSDDKLRAEYVEEVKSGNAGEKVDIAQILAAEELFQKGTILVKARKFPEAVKMLDDAIKAADESEYYAWRGYAKFFTFPDKKLGHMEAMKDINVSLKRNDKIAAVWYFQGHMAKLLGDLPAAKKYFNKCIYLSPDHLDAQRELRMMK